MYLRQMETDDPGILLDMAHAEGWSSDIFEFELYHTLNETFYYLLGRFRKPQRAQRHAEKNNTSLRLSALLYASLRFSTPLCASLGFSAVNLFCPDSFIQNKLKSHK